MIKVLKGKLVGTRPLIMHNIQLADPTNKWTREIAAITKKPKKEKTEEDAIELLKLEWFGGLYLSTQGVIGIPEDNLLKVAIEGARKTKKGKQAEAGLVGSEPFFPLKYKGPADPEELYEQGTHNLLKAVRIGQSRIMRMRPIFYHWELPFSFDIATDVLDVTTVREGLEKAGMLVGMGDFRPRYGRFTVEW